MLHHISLDDLSSTQKAQTLRKRIAHTKKLLSETAKPSEKTHLQDLLRAYLNAYQNVVRDA